MKIILILLFVICVNLIFCANVNRRKMTSCSQIPDEVLGEILGPAYNSRYMSIDIPPEVDTNQQNPGIKRAPATIPEFYVDDGFSREFGDIPAWKTSHIEQEKSLSKREVGDFKKYNAKENISHLNYDGSFYSADEIRNKGSLKGKDISDENTRRRFSEGQDKEFLFIDKQLSDSYTSKVLVKRDVSKIITGKL